jgi:hypothetical protein
MLEQIPRFKRGCAQGDGDARDALERDGSGARWRIANVVVMEVTIDAPVSEVY